MVKQIINRKFSVVKIHFIFQMISVMQNQYPTDSYKTTESLVFYGSLKAFQTKVMAKEFHWKSFATISCSSLITVEIH